MYVCPSEDNPRELVLSFHLQVPGVTFVLHPLSYLTGLL